MMNKTKLILFGAVTLAAIGGPGPAAAAEISLFQDFGDFVLREPQNPPPPGGPVAYSQTGPGSPWFVSQWDIPGEKLSPFQKTMSAGLVTFGAETAAAQVHITREPHGTEVTLSQDGSILPCMDAKNRPREFDLFLSPGEIKATGSPVVAGKGVPLTSMTALLESATVSARSSPAPHPKGCPTTKGGLVMSVTLNNISGQQHQTMFYQLSLSQYCAPGHPCSAVKKQPYFYSDKNPFGTNDELPLLGTPWLANGAPHNLRVDILPHLKELVASAPGGMDRDPSHWAVANAYIGQIMWGDMALTSVWQNYRLVAVGQ